MTVDPFRHVLQRRRLQPAGSPLRFAAAGDEARALEHFQVFRDGRQAHVEGLRQLADPTRRAILAKLAAGDASVTELAEPFDMSQPAVSKHLKVLERAGLISRSRQAQRRPRRLEPRPLAEATDWIERYRRIWEGNYKRLDAVLQELKTKQKKTIDALLHEVKPKPNKKRRTR